MSRSDFLVLLAVMFILWAMQKYQNEQSSASWPAWFGDPPCQCRSTKGDSR